MSRFELLLAAVLFSSGGAAIKLCGFDAWQVTFLRSAVAALVLRLALPGGSPARPRDLLVVGIPYAATMVLFVAGNKLTTAAATIFLQSTAPLYVLLVGPFLLHEPLRRRDLGFMLVLAAGLSLFFLGGERSSATAPDPGRGNVLAACAGLSWALTIASLRWIGRRGSARTALVAANLLTCAVCLPFVFPFPVGEPADWLVAGYLGIFQVGLAYVFMSRGLRGVGALEGSLLLLLEPVLNPIWAWLVHGEQPGPWSLAGGAVILIATAIKTLVERPRRSPSPAPPGGPPAAAG